ncbi:MAG TPA: GNAT family N-acetyltransferase, partial [Caulobacteraceae bacterium]
MKVAFAGPERAGALAAIHADAFAAPWTKEALADLMRSLGVLAFEGEGGFVLVRVLQEEAEILTLAVAPEARRRGLGRALVRAAAGA